MSLFSVSRAARADLKNIAAYTQKTWGAEQRKAYIKDLDLTFLFLAENPMSGTPCDYIISGLRKHSHESHTIFYENRDDSIFIIRILHKSMDVESQLEKP
ncbi:MAG: type II toxin-antitoxin system RelE/ParE family toxin [Pseudomonas sp.]|nr:type II toxin-antitoxin system RelE/ParE family toxin [Pseudomonas sp.]